MKKNMPNLSGALMDITNVEVCAQTTTSMYNSAHPVFCLADSVQRNVGRAGI